MCVFLLSVISFFLFFGGCEIFTITSNGNPPQTPRRKSKSKSAFTFPQVLRMASLFASIFPLRRTPCFCFHDNNTASPICRPGPSVRGLCGFDDKGLYIAAGGHRFVYCLAALEDSCDKCISLVQVGHRLRASPISHLIMWWLSQPQHKRIHTLATQNNQYARLDSNRRSRSDL